MKEEIIICRCNEVTRAEIEESIKQNGLRTIQEVKRFTRAGMGLCQGKTCGKLVVKILGGAVEPDTPRPPVRAVPIAALANSLPVEECCQDG